MKRKEQIFQYLILKCKLVTLVVYKQTEKALLAHHCCNQTFHYQKFKCMKPSSLNSSFVLTITLVGLFFN